jgi:DNA-binding MarR family transcriptional regulator
MKQESKVPSDGSDPEGAVVDGVLRASRALVAVAARSIAQVDDTVTLPQFRALVALAARGPQNMGALAEELGVHSSTATRMCDRLVSKGLIDREVSAESRREVTVRLTPTGRRLLQEVTAARRRAIGEIVAKVPGELRDALVGALQAFSEAAGEAPDQAWAVGWGDG